MARLRIFNYLRDQSGASAVEFALIAPLLVLMILGTVDAGIFIKQRMQVQNMAHTAASYVVQTQDDTNIAAVAQATYPDIYNDVTLESEFSCECSDGVAQACPLDCGNNDYQRRFIDVTASATFDALFQYPGIPSDMTVQSNVRMRVD